MAEAKTVPVLFLNDSIVLPGMVVPIALDDAARAAVDAARASESGELLIAPRLEDRYPSYGVLASIVQIGRMPGGPAAIVRGVSRAHIGTGATGPGAALWVEVTEVAEPEPTEEVINLAAEYKKLLLAMLQRREAWQIIDFVNQLSDPSALADTAGYASYLTQVQKRQLLETPDVAERLRLLIDWTGAQLAEVEVSEKIAEDVREGMEKQQKEFLLRQQLKAIRKELGEDDADSTDDYRTRIEEADLPEKVREAALREVGKLERAGDQSPESGWIRTWLDTVLELPWNVRTEDSTDLKAAREILDADHHGLEDVKDRIVEYLAVRARRAQRGMAVVGGRGSGAVMVLAGPPGVGKTSLGESVAKALGRKFVRVALGGVRDEAEIRGHRRTYVGALPGRIVRAISEAGTMNPVVLLDEIDKVGSDFRGDPAAALLEVLDPAQNHTFRDHYLDLDLDLSDVVFLATANVIENIPSALLDRMELVEIDGYTADDKLAIARDFLLPRQREKAALTADEVTVTEAALRKIAADYTREPGVRQFERLLAKLMRKVATRLADSEATSITIDEPDLVEYLGRPRFLPESAERTAVPGVATGLAVTGMGGDVLYIEANAVGSDAAGESALVLTGQLGDVMKESAQIALSYVRSHAEQLGVDPKALERRIHLHVPAGAVPKDGPSAGVTMVTALVSMATGRQVRADVGMTGEVTLNGRVLPIGGVKQKLLAAQRAGLSTVFIPQRNEADLDDVPADVLEALEVKPMTDVADIVAQALVPAEQTATAAA
ncbi:ATP-dependent protease La [Mycolicibacterium phlei]|jgi:ATP-dependent Lon protease|uniref:Lon protease n=1 Tax=Mycolicibacterium phlei DSM 43239 = CCUG 21000 TaxID=1226750 RepID=A0A5N5USF9_MYCPH|nr:endopeptidase La [Mycolicibacterium phlei]VEG09322.1 ATP-dependent protease La [Mycobacteroides chelonae]AMO61207.1 Lon protease [Mycolicibacterium phlei]EID08828.1 ATP-dependent protease La [Mycolicibacterium phlei RIVM601174]KAB7752546.1 Lon protease [Mycolicibacterium phlei DSM 43239 = CCUG 21000]KXW60896.1 Lon protease [Mycolicibacterium phlei DSM 43239 = CCUG 21000]